MLPQPLPERSHLHRLPGRLLLRGGCLGEARIPREKVSVIAFLLPKVLPLMPHYQVGNWGAGYAPRAMWEWKEPL